MKLGTVQLFAAQRLGLEFQSPFIRMMDEWMGGLHGCGHSWWETNACSLSLSHSSLLAPPKDSLKYKEMVKFQWSADQLVIEIFRVILHGILLHTCYLYICLEANEIRAACCGPGVRL
jgi:hypothetical protein